MRRSDPQFFHDTDTHAAIEEIAQFKSLVVYAGAGASIDRVGLDWSGLIERLYAKETDADAARALVRSYSAMQAATIVCHVYTKKYGSPGMLRDTLRTLLYTDRKRSGGRLARNIASLAASRAHIADAGFLLLTTNFDDYLERELQIVCAESSGALEFRRVTDPEEAEVLPGVVTCAYLHGYLPDLDRPTDERGNVETPPVLSEADYFETAGTTVRCLTRAFDSAPAIVVGASLTDPPLLEALHSTKGAHPRFAVLPLHQWRYESETERTHLIEQARMRLEAFDVQPIFPDFYFQGAQLLRECVSCARHGPGSYEAPNSTIRYGQRLVGWWRDWYGASSTDLVQTQADDHDQLKQTLGLVRKMLKARPHENLKLEVWIRWEPTDSHRRLRLWASSVGTWPDHSSMRESEIEPDSEYASVQAFCQGRPMLLPANDSSASGRWKRYFACPIWWPETEDEVPVAVVTLASMDASGSLVEVNRVAIDETRPLLEDVGKRIAGTPEPEADAPAPTT